MRRISMLTAYVARHRGLWLTSLLLPPLFGLGTQAALAFLAQEIIAQVIVEIPKLGTLVLVIVSGLAGLCIATAFSELAKYIGRRFRVLCESDMKADLFRHMIMLSPQATNEVEPGRLFTMFNADADNLTSLLTDDLSRIISPIVLGIGAILLVMEKNLLIGVVVLLPVVSVILINAAYGKRYNRLSLNKAQAADVFHGHVLAALKGKATIRVLNASHLYEAKLETASQRMMEAETAIIKQNLTKSLSMDWFVYACATLILPLACVFTAYGAIALPSVIFITQLCGSIIWNTSSLGAAILQLNKGLVSARRIMAYVSQPEEDVEDGSPMSPDGPIALRFERVRLYYDQNPVVQDINLQIKRGIFTAIVGSSGCGKSSLLKAVLGMTSYDGSISLFGKDIAGLSTAVVRSSIAYASEYNEVLSASIQENIRFGDVAASQERILESAQEAGLALSPQDTSRSATALSGGQKQRVALARALLKETPVLLLDEPTAALDHAAEEEVIANLRRRVDRGQTIVVVSHREACIREADEVIWFDGKRFVQNAGVEQALMESHWSYL